MSDNNDYTDLDWLFPNTPSVLNEDTSAGKENPPVIAPSIDVNNPPDNKIPADQKKADKPAEAAPKFKCPKCMAESAETETKGKYKCSKCGQTFSVEAEEVIKEKTDDEYRKEMLSVLKTPLKVSSGSLVDADGKVLAHMNRETGTTPLTPVQRDELLKELVERFNKGNK